MNSWISKETLIDKYELQAGAVEQFFHKNKNTDYIVHINKVAYYNETLLLEKKNNRLKMWNENHVNYYDIQINKKMSDSQQARETIEYTGVGSLASFVTYMTYGMWYPIMDYGILLLKESTYMIAYNEWSNVYLGKKTPEVDLTGFNNVDDYYGYYEAERMLSELRGNLNGM